MLEIRLGGIPCKISLLFPAVLLCLLGTDQSGMGAFGFLAAVLHESGHLLTLCLFGEKPAMLTISFYGMRLTLGRDNRLTFCKELIVAAAGPLINLLCAGFLYMANAGISFVMLHLVLAALNGLPILPLDGGWVCCRILEHFFGEHATEVVMSYVFWIVWTPLVVLGIALLWHSGYNFTLLIVCTYLIFLKLFYKGN